MRARTVGSVGAVLALMLAPGVVGAQLARDSAVDWLVSAGSEGEQYLRVLQVAGLAAPTQWTVRPFSASVLRAIAPPDSGHPWVKRFNARTTAVAKLRLLQPELLGIINSTFPYGYNDGPIWAGRGLTLAATVGARGQMGPLSFTLAPQVFWAQNADFPLAPNGRSGPQRFGDASTPDIDLPQRFGDAAYYRLDPGQTTLQLSVLHLTVGASTANEAWGPAEGSPFLLGNNAAGFAHLFAGTDGTLALGAIQLNVRLIAGRLDQSPYSYATPDASNRYISGVVASFGVRQLPGLEIGGGRLFENVWPDSGFGLGDVVRPLFQNLLKTKLSTKFGNLGDRPDNQLASIFARWMLPASGIEVYGEYGREDNAWDTRDLLLEPDHEVSYLVGLTRVWRRPESRLLVFRAELQNSAISDLARVRSQAPVYSHSPVHQGHTQFGQVLGAPFAFGGGGTSIALDWYSPTSRISVGLRRAMREPGTSPSSKHDVFHALSVDALLFRSRVDVGPELTLVYNASRNGGGDAFDARAAVTARAHW